MLAINQEAQELHIDGHEQRKSGNYVQAHRSFNAARAIIDSSELTVDSTLQLAAITRDDGFAYVYQATAKNWTSLLAPARETLTRAVETTAPLYSGTAFLRAELPQPHDTPKHARHEVAAEHGSSVGLIGRLVTAEEVMQDFDTRGNGLAAKKAREVDQQPYGLAHDILRHGSNGYYRVSNAMTAARQERLNGQLVQMAVWLGRAGLGIGWTMLYDRRNAGDAWRTFGSRIRHLRSYNAARRSVYSHP